MEGDDFKRLQKKTKKLGAKYLGFSKRKNNKYVVEYEGKKIHFGSTNKDLDRREKYLAKSQTKMVIILIILHHFQIIGL